MTYSDWLALSEPERVSIQAQWNAYSDGYWHELVRLAAEDFRTKYKDTPHIVRIHNGLYHCGELHIAVHIDLPHPQRMDLPERHAGFIVRQFRTMPPNQPLHPDALTRAGERRRYTQSQ